MALRLALNAALIVALLPLVVSAAVQAEPREGSLPVAVSVSVPVSPLPLPSYVSLSSEADSPALIFSRYASWHNAVMAALDTDTNGNGTVTCPTAPILLWMFSTVSLMS